VRPAKPARKGYFAIKRQTSRRVPSFTQPQSLSFTAPKINPKLGPFLCADQSPARARTLAFADIAALRPHLVPEVPIWSNSEGGRLTAGRADAVAVQGNVLHTVLDWKSDVSPSRDDRSLHIAQLKDYVDAIGAPKGAIVYMSLGEVVWIEAGSLPKSG
jgi:hypothetical protein